MVSGGIVGVSGVVGYRVTEPAPKLTEIATASDAALLAAAARRDATAYAGLVTRYEQQVFRVVWRLTNGHTDTQDITQETFLRLWRKPEQLREPGALKGWLLRVASNLAMDRFRAKPMLDLDVAEQVDDGRPNAEDQMATNWATRKVDAAIAALPDRQKLALTLVHFEQLGNIRAAAAMEISVDALESLLARARRSLKITLAADKEMLFAGLVEGK